MRYIIPKINNSTDGLNILDTDRKKNSHLKDRSKETIQNIAQKIQKRHLEDMSRRYNKCFSETQKTRECAGDNILKRE